MSTITVGPLREDELAAADHIMRLAFGTFLGLPEPTTFMGDADYVRTRWAADSTAAFGARLDGELIGSNFATNWGSVGFFGPRTVHPAHWNTGIGSRLVEPVLALFDRWGVTHTGLFTFSYSDKHAWLYQKFGFWRTGWPRLSDLGYSVRVVTVRQLIPPALTTMAPGPELGVLLAGIDIHALTGSDAVEVLQARARQVSQQSARWAAAHDQPGQRAHPRRPDHRRPPEGADKPSLVHALRDDLYERAT